MGTHLMHRHCKAEISRLKGHILDSNGRGFCGEGYIFKKALSDLREKGHIIKYNRKKCSYFLENQRRPNHE